MVETWFILGEKQRQALEKHFKKEVFNSNNTTRYLTVNVDVFLCHGNNAQNSINLNCKRLINFIIFDLTCIIWEMCNLVKCHF